MCCGGESREQGQKRPRTLIRSFLDMTWELIVNLGTSPEYNYFIK